MIENDPQTAPDPATLCARPPSAGPASDARPIAPPLVLASVFDVGDPDRVDALYQGAEPGFIYARDAHPNAAQLADKLARIEGAESALICGSGMAAEAALMLALLGQGDRVAISDGLYGRTMTLVDQELSRFGVGSDRFDATRPDTLDAALTPQTKLVFTETLSNPLLRLADLPALARTCRSRGVPLAVDHTFAPLLCRPIELGATFVVHSATKAIGGHGDVTLGALIGPKDALGRIAHLASTFGLTGNPFDSWMAMRGLSTLAVRVARAGATAANLADRLARHPAVRKVHYPGLPYHPDHNRATWMLPGGFGSMISFDVGDRDRANRLVRALEHIPYAPSLGDVSTTLSHPTTTSHRSQSPAQWAAQGITPGLIRLSVGLEDPDDLWRDLGAALTGLGAA